MEHQNFMKTGEEFENKVLNKSVVQNEANESDAIKPIEKKKMLTSSISNISR